MNENNSSHNGLPHNERESYGYWKAKAENSANSVGRRRFLKTTGKAGLGAFAGLAAAGNFKRAYAATIWDGYQYISTSGSVLPSTSTSIVPWTSTSTSTSTSILTSTSTSYYLVSGIGDATSSSPHTFPSGGGGPHDARGNLKVSQSGNHTNSITITAHMEAWFNNYYANTVAQSDSFSVTVSIDSSGAITGGDGWDGPAEETFGAEFTASNNHTLSAAADGEISTTSPNSTTVKVELSGYSSTEDTYVTTTPYSYTAPKAFNLTVGKKTITR